MKIEKTVMVELDTGEIAKLHDAEFGGWCQVCRNVETNVGETICCDCLAQALAYHTNTCGCQP